MAVEGDSYCAEANVTAFAQMGDYTPSTTPTQAEVLVFMAGRAGELYSVLVRVMGNDAVGPASYSKSIDNSSDAGKALEFVLIQYNAIGAAMDSLLAAGAGESPQRSERVNELFGVWQEREAAITLAAEQFLGASSESATHISVGEVTVASTTSREEDGIRFNGLTEF